MCVAVCMYVRMHVRVYVHVCLFTTVYMPLCIVLLGMDVYCFPWTVIWRSKK